MRLRRTVLTVLCVALVIATGAAQSPDGAQPENASTAVVQFELNWAQADPQHYSISMDPSGRTKYKSEPKLEAGEGARDPFTIEFTATEETRRSVFDLAKQAKFFDGDFEYKAKNIAQTGTKTLRYKDGKTQHETSFNYSTNPAITELTTLFQRISATMEAGRRLGFSLRFDKLGVDQQLKQMEDMKNRGSLVEVQALEPMLRKIIQDKSYMNVSRQRAQRLLGITVSPAGSR